MGTSTLPPPALLHKRRHSLPLLLAIPLITSAGCSDDTLIGISTGAVTVTNSGTGSGGSGGGGDGVGDESGSQYCVSGCNGVSVQCDNDTDNYYYQPSQFGGLIEFHQPVTVCVGAGWPVAFAHADRVQVLEDHVHGLTEGLLVGRTPHIRRKPSLLGARPPTGRGDHRIHVCRTDLITCARDHLSRFGSVRLAA